VLHLVFENVIIEDDWMEINNLVSLEKLTPLSAVVGQIDPVTYLGQSLYRLGGGIYFYLTKFGGAGLILQGPFCQDCFAHRTMAQ
jgi:hypothetical protein